MISSALALEIVGVTASGALSPGPLTFAAVFGGRSSGVRYGLLEALGHMIFELPLFLFLSLGFSAALVSPDVPKYVSALGGGSLLAYAALTFKELLSGSSQTNLSMSSTHPVVVGFALTALNPYFLAWWFSAGVKLVADILLYSSSPIFLLLSYAIHVWMDYLWLALIAWLAHRGEAKLPRLMRFVQASLVVALVYYGIVFLSGVFT